MEVLSAVIGAVAGGVVVSLVWMRLRPSAERRRTLIEQRMRDRWEAAGDVRYALSELNRCKQHVFHGRLHYAERGGEFVERARTAVERHRGLLGREVEQAVRALTDAYEHLFRRASEGSVPDDLATQLHDLQRRTSSLIDESLTSLPRS